MAPLDNRVDSVTDAAAWRHIPAEKALRPALLVFRELCFRKTLSAWEDGPQCRSTQHECRHIQHISQLQARARQTYSLFRHFLYIFIYAYILRTTFPPSQPYFLAQSATWSKFFLYLIQAMLILHKGLSSSLCAVCVCEFQRCEKQT